jgi:hypothetical protein
LVEARSSTKQGQAVMLFTIVTVVFVSQVTDLFLVNATDSMTYSYRFPSLPRISAKTSPNSLGTRKIQAHGICGG